MTDELIDKLWKRIHSGIATEEDAVYLMVKLRKLLEREGLKKKLVTLRFFADWSVHTELTGPEAQALLATIDGLFEGNQAGWRKVVLETLSMTRLRDEFRGLCSRYELPLDLVDSDANWRAFRDLLAANLADCDLVAADGLTGVRSLSFHWSERGLRVVVMPRKGEPIEIGE